MDPGKIICFIEGIVVKYQKDWNHQLGKIINKAKLPWLEIFRNLSRQKCECEMWKGNFFQDPGVSWVLKLAEWKFLTFM